MVEISSADRLAMEATTAGLPTTSAKIRALAEKKFKRADIARFLGIRYQHVRNVLNQPLARRAADERAETAVPFEPSSRTPETQHGDEDSPVRVYRFDVDREGRIKLPPSALRELGVAPGRMLSARFEDGELRLMSIEAAVRFVQELAAPYIKEHEGNWSDEMIADRRAEAAREAERDRR